MTAPPNHQHDGHPSEPSAGPTPTQTDTVARPGTWDAEDIAAARELAAELFTGPETRNEIRAAVAIGQLLEIIDRRAES